jgi:hypothetical protein
MFYPSSAIDAPTPNRQSVCPLLFKRSASIRCRRHVLREASHWQAPNSVKAIASLTANPGRQLRLGTVLVAQVPDLIE